MSLAAPQATREQALTDAFRLFNQVSEQLASSYQLLQRQVEELSAELAAARSERMRQMEEKERLADRLARLLETLPAAVVELNGDDRIVDFNPAAAELLGHDLAGAAWGALAARLFDGVTTADGELRLRDGRRLTLSQRQLEQNPGRILVLVDVTETRRLQHRLERRERLAEMGEMAAKLAHQIRTPMSAALLYASHLARPDLADDQQRRFSRRLRERLQHMERQVDDLLVFTRGAGERVERLDLSALLADLARATETQLEAAAAQLVVERPARPLPIYGNRDALLGALNNLVTNALEHGSAQRIRLALAIERGEVVLRLSDDGAGIPQHQRGQVFDPFYTTSATGTGLGLAVVQSVVLSHQGHIELQESPEGGACFVMGFPVLADAGATGPAGHRDPAGARPPAAVE